MPEGLNSSQTLGKQYTGLFEETAALLLLANERFPVGSAIDRSTQTEENSREKQVPRDTSWHDGVARCGWIAIFFEATRRVEKAVSSRARALSATSLVCAACLGYP